MNTVGNFVAAAVGKDSALALSDFQTKSGLGLLGDQRSSVAAIAVFVNSESVVRMSHNFPTALGDRLDQLLDYQRNQQSKSKLFS